MHHSIRYILGIAAVLGTFPVCNITNRSTQALQFKWFSFVTTYTLLLLGGFIAIEIIAIDYSIQHLNQANLTVAGKHLNNMSVKLKCSSKWEQTPTNEIANHND